MINYSDVWTSFGNWHTQMLLERSLRDARHGAVQSFSGL